MYVLDYNNFLTSYVSIYEALIEIVFIQDVGMHVYMCVYTSKAINNCSCEI